MVTFSDFLWPPPVSDISTQLQLKADSLMLKSVLWRLVETRRSDSRPRKNPLTRLEFDAWVEFCEKVSHVKLGRAPLCSWMSCQSPRHGSCRISSATARLSEVHTSNYPVTGRMGPLPGFSTHSFIFVIDHCWHLQGSR